MAQFWFMSQSLICWRRNLKYTKFCSIIHIFIHRELQKQKKVVQDSCPLSSQCLRSWHTRDLLNNSIRSVPLLPSFQDWRALGRESGHLSTQGAGEGWELWSNPGSLTAELVSPIMPKQGVANAQRRNRLLSSLSPLCSRGPLWTLSSAELSLTASTRGHTPPHQCLAP